MGGDERMAVEYQDFLVDGDPWVPMRPGEGWSNCISFVNASVDDTYMWDFNRSYPCYAVMAGVRNGWVDLQSLPWARGVPADAHAVTREIVAADEPECYHSRTWFTLAELVAFDFSQPWPVRDGEPPETYAEVCARLVDLRDELLRRAEYFGVYPPHVRVIVAFDN